MAYEKTVSTKRYSAVSEAAKRLLEELPSDSATAFFADDPGAGAILVSAEGVIIYVDWAGQVQSTTLNDLPWKPGTAGNVSP